MSVSGLCQICESRQAQERCGNCGTFACAQHYESADGVCADCAAQGRPDRQSDDVDTYRF
jgi:hypothetical protein